MTDSVFLSSDLSILKSEYKRDQIAYFVKKNTNIYLENNKTTLLDLFSSRSA